MESIFGRFWRYQDTRISLDPLDENQPRLGGRVTASQRSFDIRTFTLQSKTYHGVYGEDFLTYGEFAPGANADDEATLLQIFEEGSDAVVDRHHFKFDGGRVNYSRTVDGQQVDADIEHAIEETALQSEVGDSWSETFFYGAGNAKM